MANSATRMILKNGKSFPQLLCRPLVGGLSNVNVGNKDQLPLISPTQLLYLQRPVLGNGFNFVDFVLGKDHELLVDHWKSSAVVEARGNQRQRYDSDEAAAAADNDDDEFNNDDEVEYVDEDEDEDTNRWG